MNSKMTRHIAILISGRVPLMEQEVLALLEQMDSLPIISWVLVTRSLVLCVCFLVRCLSFSPFSFCCLFFDLRILITLLVSSNSYSSHSYISTIRVITKLLNTRSTHCWNCSDDVIERHYTYFIHY